MYMAARLLEKERGGGDIFSPFHSHPPQVPESSKKFQTQRETSGER